MNYSLRYYDRHIGNISNVKSNFPSYCGDLNLVPDWEQMVDDNAKLNIQLGLGQVKEDDLTMAQFESFGNWMSEAKGWSVFYKNEVKVMLPPSFRLGYISWRFKN